MCAIVLCAVRCMHTLYVVACCGSTRSIAALLLTHVGEVDAFWCMCYLCERVMTNWFIPRRVALEVRRMGAWLLGWVVGWVGVFLLCFVLVEHLTRPALSCLFGCVTTNKPHATLSGGLRVVRRDAGALPAPCRCQSCGCWSEAPSPGPALASFTAHGLVSVRSRKHQHSLVLMCCFVLGFFSFFFGLLRAPTPLYLPL